MEPSQDMREPDYRFTLANERTFLAWIRTALALIAGGVAVVQLVPALSIPGVRHGLGTVLTAGRWGAGGAVGSAMAERADCDATGCRTA
jgi:putative membrane protein